MKTIFFRTIVIYLCVWSAMRLMGKRQLSELQPGEFVSTMLISNLASISIESSNVPILSSLIPLFIIAGIEIVSSALSLKSRKFADFIQGRPKMVIQNGTINQTVLKELRLSVADLLCALRSKDIFDPREVSCAIVETDGSLSVAKMPQNETVTRNDLALFPPAEQVFVPLILEGEVLEENLLWCKKTQAWLDEHLSQAKISQKQVLALLNNGTDDFYLICENTNKGKIS